ncbi:MAG TPA: DUF5681 domain-containing protein, partial [Streptosporangiaceae bacterium]|nr:DUF5681 domain-containing protein [Streptosporangiaceae bacterium]
MRIPLRRCGLRGFAWHSACAWRDDHGGIRAACRDLGVDIVPVVRAISREGRHRTIDPVEQGADLRAVIGIPAGQHRGDDLARDRELQRKIVVREGGEPRTMSKHEAMAKQLVNKALAGDLQATKLVLQLRAQAAAERAATAPVIDAEPELPGFDPNLLKTEE